MNTVGIIAEYNPLHRGHAYHIRKSRSLAEADAVISVISANFVQRGLPSLADKSLRAAMALSCGADLVLELPVVFSSHNAGIFANAAVDILAATGLTSAISFGMETPDPSMLRAIADALNEEPPAFKGSLKKFLRAGHSFVQSRSLALEESLPGSLAFLKSPNNSLAVSYVKRIREKGYGMAAFAVERAGAGFHDEKLPDGDAAASAAAIRALLRQGEAERAFPLMPDESAGLLRGALEAGRLADCHSRLWFAVRHAILREGAEGMRKISEMGEGLENRMLDSAWRSGSFESFVTACTSRRYTAGRIQRHAMHLLISLGHEESRRFQRLGPAYIRILGANGTGRKLLSLMRKTASLPVISRASVPKRAPDSFTGVSGVSDASRMMEIECRATEIWEMLTDSPEIRSEARRVPVIK